MTLNSRTRFDVFQSDNEQTIKERIARTLGTTVFWLDIETADVTETDDIVAVNVLDDLKQQVDSDSFSDLELRYSRWLSGDKDKLDKLARMFIIMYTDQNGTDFNSKVILEQLFYNEAGTDYLFDFIEDTIAKRDSILLGLRRDIEDNKRKSLKQDEEMARVNAVVDRLVDVDITPFETTSIVVSLVVKTDEQVVLSHVFNQLPRDGLMFARYNDFFIVANPSTKYDYDANYTRPDSLLIVYPDREILIRGQYDSFVVEMSNVSDLTPLLGQHKILERNNIKIKGKFSLLGTSYTRELLLDEIMNNNKFFMMYHNERKRVTKHVTSRLNLYCYMIKTGYVSFSLSQDGGNVNVSVTNITSEDRVEYFINVFTSAFKAYKARENYLLGIYRSFIPNAALTGVVDATPQSRSRKNPLSEKEPTLFVALYTRKCAKPPRIVEEGEPPPDGYDTIDFPLYNEGGLRPRRYVCDQTGEYRYPGLRRNTLHNNRVFDYIPCCYETDQVKRKGSPWNAYLAGNQDKTRKYEHSLYKTNRVLPEANKGLLPPGLVKLFGRDVNRLGVFVGPNSFIDAVDRAVEKIEGKAVKLHVEQSRLQELEKIRQRLNPYLCSQDNSDCLDTYVEWFKNVEHYFEPRRFYRAVEEFFKVNIYLFERSADHAESPSRFIKTNTPDGVLALPNMPRRGLYVDSKRFDRDVYIYTHMGGAIDTLSYPHSEYIDAPGRIELVGKVYDYLMVRVKRDPRSDFVDDPSRGIEYIDSTGRRATDGMLPTGLTSRLEETQQPRVDPVREYARIKRLGRLMLEYYMIKNKPKMVVDPTRAVYDTVADEYSLEYYDSIFSNDAGEMVVDSEDTKRRIEYSASKMIDDRDVNRKVLLTYYDSVMDFDGDDVVKGEEAFREIMFGSRDHSYTMVNSLHDIQDRYRLVFMRNDDYPELNGFFSVGTFNSQQGGVWYVWQNNKFTVVKTSDTGGVHVVYKLNGTLYCLNEHKAG